MVEYEEQWEILALPVLLLHTLPVGVTLRLVEEVFKLDSHYYQETLVDLLGVGFLLAPVEECPVMYHQEDHREAGFVLSGVMVVSVLSSQMNLMLKLPVE
jgi:hypothetical protein